MAFNPRDSWFQKAKSEGFAARSIYKLEEIDQRLRIIKSGDQILDLGASPGSWSQYCAKKVGPGGKVLGIDLSPVQVSLKNAVFLQADLRDCDMEALCTQHAFAPEFSVVLSDMAPKTTGIKMTDQARSMELCDLALDIAIQRLKPGGHFVCKLFHSSEFSQLRDRIKKNFQKFEAIKPDSTRKESKEIFLVGLNRNRQTPIQD